MCCQLYNTFKTNDYIMFHCDLFSGSKYKRWNILENELFKFEKTLMILLKNLNEKQDSLRKRTCFRKMLNWLPWSVRILL